MDNIIPVVKFIDVLRPVFKCYKQLNHLNTIVSSLDASRTSLDSSSDMLARMLVLFKRCFAENAGSHKIAAVVRKRCLFLHKLLRKLR